MRSEHVCEHQRQNKNETEIVAYPDKTVSDTRKFPINRGIYVSYSAAHFLTSTAVFQQPLSCLLVFKEKYERI